MKTKDILYFISLSISTISLSMSAYSIHQLNNSAYELRKILHGYQTEEERNILIKDLEHIINSPKSGK